jgi:hypothetical protein
MTSEKLLFNGPKRHFEFGVLSVLNYKTTYFVPVEKLDQVIRQIAENDVG